MVLKHAEWKTVLFGKSLEEGEGGVFGCLDNWECWVWRCQVLMGTQKAETIGCMDIVYLVYFVVSVAVIQILQGQYKTLYS